MMNAACRDIKDYIKGLVDSSEADISYEIFAFYLPDSPDQCIAFIEGPGMPPFPGNIRRGSVQILVRGKKGEMEEGYGQMEVVLSHLHEKGNLLIGSTNYHTLWLQGDVMFTRDEKGRPIWSTNLSVDRSE